MPTKPSRATRPGGKQKPAPPKKTKGGAGGHQGRITVPKSAPKKPGKMPKSGKDMILIMGEVFKKNPKAMDQMHQAMGVPAPKKKTTKKRKPE